MTTYKYKIDRDLSRYIKTPIACQQFFVTGIDGTNFIERSGNFEIAADVVWHIVGNIARAKPSHDGLRRNHACRFDLETTNISTIKRAAALCNNRVNVVFLSRTF